MNNPNRRYKNYMNASDLLLIILPIILVVVLFTIFYLNPIHKKNTEQLPQNKPIDRQTISTDNITGNVESIHPWGRTEVVPMKSVELEYFEYCDEWVMYGDVVQPTGRKGYFMPVLKGRLNFSVRDLTQTWIKYGSYATGPEEKAETYEDFRVADIRIKEGKIIDINYSHYRLLSDHSWSIIASWKAIVNPDIPDPVPENVQTNDVPLIVCSFCKGKGETVTDINKLMMDASLAIFFNHHLMVDKCEKCVKLPNGDGYDYCDVVNERYQTLLKEYGAVGPKMDMAACSECMGMGTFSSQDSTTGKWLTQEEYDEKNKNN
jgi:hypothetical protein